MIIVVNLRPDVPSRLYDKAPFSLALFYNDYLICKDHLARAVEIIYHLLLICRNKNVSVWTDNDLIFWGHWDKYNNVLGETLLNDQCENMRHSEVCFWMHLSDIVLTYNLTRDVQYILSPMI